ncbi:MAG: hypothetical protein M1827_000136 [Pycnora praestabilis]|nr:MAG: hypothetical protein M1827_000136 [Pycnora praestabilis]
MRPDQEVSPQADHLGNWLPPDVFGGNILVGEGATGRTFSWDPNTGVVQQTVIVGNPQVLRAFSVYFDRDRFFIVPYDATQCAVHEQFPTWRGMTFDHDQNSVSYVGYAGEENRLATANTEQTWPSELFPQTYLPLAPNNDSGGLVGDIAIILALAAFSIVPEYVQYGLENGLGAGRWQSHGVQSGRNDNRGVVVRVYASPPWNEGHLRAFETGRYGAIFE